MVESFHIDRRTGNQQKLSWVGFHASQLRNEECDKVNLPATAAVLSLIYKKAHSPSMVKQGLEKLSEAIHHANPGQIPVIAMDQPLFAIAKDL